MEGSTMAARAGTCDGVLGHDEFDADHQIKPEGLDFLFVRTTPESARLRS